MEVGSQATSQRKALAERFEHVRATTLAVCQTLEREDFVVQSMPDASPAKWHLAHTTWFFERFVLQAHVPAYRLFDERFDYLFNSYYYTAGDMHPRPQRGLLTRPGIERVMDYRRHVDENLLQWLDSDTDSAVLDVIELGTHHEQQHQELLLTDIKHGFSCNPLEPAVAEAPAASDTAAPEHRFIETDGGIHAVGASGEHFCFDNELPRHEVLLRPFSIGSRLVTNGEYREFIRDGGYDHCALWLSDGWAAARDRGWRRPLYWGEDLETEFTLGGRQELDLAAPVVHVSYYEADAYARWAEARLPTEFEWEVAAASAPVEGEFMESRRWHPRCAGSADRQWFGNAWEWTSSAYAAYPGFVPLAGSLGEYNGKFMCNQQTVRGGSCVSARDHLRASYRSFFYPDARWQFLGIRLAGDGD